MSTLRLRAALPHGVSLLVWLILGFSACAWVLRAQGSTSVALGRDLPSTQRLEPDSAMVVRALGTPPAGKAAATNPVLDSGRFVLAGVIDQGAGKGAALIAVDGKPAKAFATGAVVADGWVLARVARQSAWIAAQGSSGDGVQVHLVPADSKKPLTVSAGSSLALPTVEITKPAPSNTGPSLSPSLSPGLPRSALGVGMSEGARGAATEASVPAANKGN